MLRVSPAMFNSFCTPLSSITIIKLFEISLPFPLKIERKADRTAKEFTNVFAQYFD